MAGTAVIDDEFTGLASGVTISARVPPLCDSGASYAVDPNTAGATGGGANDVKFAGIGCAVKIRSILISAAIQVVMNDMGGNEEFGIFTRDTFNTPNIRQGHRARFRTRFFGGTSGYFTCETVTEYNPTAITGLSQVPWTFAANGINTVALESLANNHRVIINGVVAASYTSELYPAVANASKYGVTYYSGGNSVMRMDRLSVYDSIVVQQSTAYEIVRVS